MAKKITLPTPATSAKGKADYSQAAAKVTAKDGNVAARAYASYYGIADDDALSDPDNWIAFTDGTFAPTTYE
jgi:hypothetical protein